MTTTANLGLEQIADNDTSWGDKARGNNAIIDLAVVSHHYAEDSANHSGLNFAHKGGVVRQGTTISATIVGSVLLTDDATNYVEVDPSDGTVSANATGFTAGKIPLYEVVAVSGAISTVTDKRAFLVHQIFPDMDKLSNKGDLLVYNGSAYVRLAAGTNGQVLTADSTQAAGVKWASIP